MTLKAKISIGRPSRSDDKSVIRFEITDQLSRKKFMRFEMSPEAFALALTGLSEQDAEVELMNLSVVGKRKESKPLQIHLDHDFMLENNLSSLDKPWLVLFIQTHAAKWVDPGWELNPSLSSQGSLVYAPGQDGVLLNVHQFRFVESEE